MYRILLVDDEPNILSALRRCLSAINVEQLDGDALRIETFTSPQAAIDRCEEQDFDLVISDYRMPAMSGVELLSRLMEIQPNAPRVIISGYADRDAIIAAVNEANLTRFIEKPWNDPELRKTIASILAGVGAAKRGTVAGSLDSGPSTNGDRQLERLEKDCPGITQIERGEDGGIDFPMDDTDF
jgi:two-component system, probable response regulator PhcQ